MDPGLSCRADQAHRAISVYRGQVGRTRCRALPRHLLHRNQPQSRTRRVFSAPGSLLCRGALRRYCPGYGRSICKSAGACSTAGKAELALPGCGVGGHCRWRCLYSRGHLLVWFCRSGAALLSASPGYVRKLWFAQRCTAARGRTMVICLPRWSGHTGDRLGDGPWSWSWCGARWARAIGTGCPLAAGVCIPSGGVAAADPAFCLTGCVGMIDQ